MVGDGDAREDKSAAHTRARKREVVLLEMWPDVGPAE
jgi:hypothetical protein